MREDDNTLSIVGAVVDGKLTRRLTELPAFDAACVEALGRHDSTSIAVATTLACHLYIKACRDLVGPLIDSQLSAYSCSSDPEPGCGPPWLVQILDKNELTPELIGLCVVLTRQRPTAKFVSPFLRYRQLAAMALEKGAEIPELFQMARTLDHFIYWPTGVSENENMIEQCARVQHLQETAFALGLTELALAPLSSSNNEEDLRIYLEDLPVSSRELLASKLQMRSASVEGLVAEYRTRPYAVKPAVLDCSGLVIDTGVFLDMNDYLCTRTYELGARMHGKIQNLVSRQKEKIETGRSFKYAAPIGSLSIEKFGLSRFGDICKSYTVKIGYLEQDLSLTGQRYFKTLQPGYPLVLATRIDATPICICEVVCCDPLSALVPSNVDIDAAFWLLAPPLESDWCLYKEARMLKPNFPEKFHDKFLGFGPPTHQSGSVDSYIRSNDLVLLKIPPTLEKVLPVSLHSLDRRLLVLVDSRVPLGNLECSGLDGLVYKVGSDGMETLLKSKLMYVAHLAEKHGLSAFLNGSAASAIYLCNRIGEYKLAALLHQLAPLEILSNSNRTKYFVDVGADIVFMNIEQALLWLPSNFTSIMVIDACSIPEVQLASVLSEQKLMEKLILVGQAQSPRHSGSLFTRLEKLYGAFALGNPSAHPEIFNVYKEAYPEVVCSDEYETPMVGFENVINSLLVQSQTASHSKVCTETAIFALYVYAYMRLLNYKSGDITILADTGEQLDLIASICEENKLFQRPFIGYPLVVTTPVVAKYIIVSGTEQCSIESYAMYALSGIVLLSPSEKTTPLGIVCGEMYGHPVTPRNATKIVNFEHLESYVSNMLHKREEWESSKGS